MPPTEKTGLLLLNLGSPASPDTGDVRAYLREFLSDPRVIDIPAWRRWLILNLFILPFRPRQSGEAYRQIWTDQGSPLILHTEKLAAKVQRRLGPRVAVDFAMRYGQPSIRSVVERMIASGVDRFVVFPLYPQYSSATTGSTIEEVVRRTARRRNVPYLQIVPPFYDHPAFIDAYAAVARPQLERLGAERVYFSFHGLPERQVRKSDATRAHCLRIDGCCKATVEANRHCYRAQCYATARLLADRLGVADEDRRVCFQSRLGREPWIQPYTDEMIVADARQGCKRAAILSPAFVADCLETLEELGIRAVESWRANGGETLQLISCPNSEDVWADAVVTIAREHGAWLDRAAASSDSGERSGVRSAG